MKFLDKYLQKWRINKVKKFLPKESFVLDIGTYDGFLFKTLKLHGIGIDSEVQDVTSSEEYHLLKGVFPHLLPKECTAQPFSAITMLAVLEHIPDEYHEMIGQTCHDLLAKDGIVVITVPELIVDKILSLLQALHLIDPPDFASHHGFLPAQTLSIFSPTQFKMVLHKKFQLGLNNLFVFRKLS